MQNAYLALCIAVRRVSLSWVGQATAVFCTVGFLITGILCFATPYKVPFALTSLLLAIGAGLVGSITSLIQARLKQPVPVGTFIIGMVFLTSLLFAPLSHFILP